MLHASGHPRELLRTSLSFSNGAWGRERAHLMLSGKMNNPGSALDSHRHTHMVAVQAHPHGCCAGTQRYSSLCPPTSSAHIPQTGHCTRKPEPGGSPHPALLCLRSQLSPSMLTVSAQESKYEQRSRLAKYCHIFSLDILGTKGWDTNVTLLPQGHPGWGCKNAVLSPSLYFLQVLGRECLTAQDVACQSHPRIRRRLHQKTQEGVLGDGGP